MAKETKEFMCGWLRGFFDGEGSARFYRYTGTSNSRTRLAYNVTVVNTCPVLTATCKRYLDALKICYFTHDRPSVRSRGTYTATGKTLYLIGICRSSSIVLFADLVGFTGPEKARRLKRIIEWVTRDRHTCSPDKLRTLYWSKNMTLSEIALYLGDTKKYAKSRISNLMKKHGIPTRGRGRRTQ